MCVCVCVCEILKSAFLPLFFLCSASLNFLCLLSLCRLSPSLGSVSLPSLMINKTLIRNELVSSSAWHQILVTTETGFYFSPQPPFLLFPERRKDCHLFRSVAAILPSFLSQGFEVNTHGCCVSVTQSMPLLFKPRVVFSCKKEGNPYLLKNNTQYIKEKNTSEYTITELEGALEVF
uniref:Uncharacterized protein n=1 Tax=Micrurus corallinus TaxID=54390 RepID=A0A2D4ES75_MICCO